MGCGETTTAALSLSPYGGCCEWVIPDSDGRLVLDLEPDSRWWMRWLGSLLQPLAPENHLQAASQTSRSVPGECARR